MGTARFMKTLRGRHKDGYVVVKLFIKPETGLNLSKQIRKIREESKALSDVPNAFYCQRVMETDKAAYLVRQCLYSSLYDRISTRPFLTLIEKKWVAYQILRGMADSHARNVYHGDFKTENVLVTTWNWAYIADYAFYKPTYLPENNPADFSYFFDTSYRRTCYIAPERFYKSGTEIDQKMRQKADGDEQLTYKSELTDKMDIFSTGCVIAELFLEGTPLFTLSQLFKYRTGEYNPNSLLEQIEDIHIRDMILHMIQIDPEKRLSAEKYLDQWHEKAFPHYFYAFLYPYMCSLNEKEEQHQRDHHHNLHHHAQKHNTKNTAESTIIAALSSAYPSISKQRKLTDADEKIERIFYDFDRIIHNVSIQCDNDTTSSNVRTKRRPSNTATSVLLPHYNSTIPTILMKDENCETANPEPDEGAFLLLSSFVCSMIRNTLYPNSRLKALDIILALSQRLPDDVKLDRLVPYLIVLLTDESALVRANAIKTLTQVLCLVESISPINTRIFPEYILPSIRPFATDPEVLVRYTYASCIALLAETALRFLEMTQLLKSEEEYPVQQQQQDTFDSAAAHDQEDLDLESAYDTALQDLQAVIQEQAITLLIDPESSVKRALLTNITCLCVFFGRRMANDVLLSHMITYLNDKDWLLRSAFFESIKGVGTFVGARSLEEYILPLMVQALTDAEEFVVEKVLNSLTSLADLGLFQKMNLWELTSIIWPLLCHPNSWIRNGAVGFISSTIKHLPNTDLWCIIYPMLRPFLNSDIAEVNEQNLIENIKKPISRRIYEQAIIWATKATSQSVFWNQQHIRGKLHKGSASSRLSTMSQRSASMFNSTYSLEAEPQYYSKEDEVFLDRLRSFGMTLQEETKLKYMREYIYKVSKSKISRPKISEEHNAHKGEVFLKNLNVTPMTVFLPDLSQKLYMIKTKNTLPKKGSGDGQATTALSTNTKFSNKPKEYIDVGNHVASQPHIQALSPALLNKEKHNHSRDSSIPFNVAPTRSDAIPIPLSTSSNKQNRLSQQPQSFSSPIPSPSDFHFESSSSIPYTLVAETNNGNSLLNTEEQDKNLNETTELSKSHFSPIGYTHLQTLLYETAMEAFPPNIPELVGDPLVMKRIKKLTSQLTQQQQQQQQQLNNSTTMSNSTGYLAHPYWKPEGNLVAHFTEHTAAINQLAISFDHLLFASCSDDGTVRIWDCSRLERNVTNRSRATYHQQGGRIKCITFIENTYSIAAASDNGSIHIFRVDIRNSGTGGLKFGKCLPVREYQLSGKGEYAVTLAHFTSNASNTMAGSKSILVFATTHCNIYALDVLTMDIVWTLKNPKSHGVITSMISDPKHMWLLVGTMRGILTLYDLRFQISLRSWQHPTKTRISAMTLVSGVSSADSREQQQSNHMYGNATTRPNMNNNVDNMMHSINSSNDDKVLIKIASGRNEISVWDIEHLKCMEVYAVKQGDEKTTGVMLESYKPLETPTNHDLLVTSFTNNETHLVENSIQSIVQVNPIVVLTGGTDRKIRFWDTSRIENSGIVLGMDIDESKPRYSFNLLNNIKFYFEFTSTTTPSTIAAAATAKSASPSTSSSLQQNSYQQRQRPIRGNIHGTTSLSTNRSDNPINSDNFVIQQQNLLKNHTNAITDIIITERPYLMIISADRDGVIKVIA
ncbi:hypothetical protein BDF20DRAFT_913285 [Mycotypha africana]|uniref:uncharacterized protein n=1 Tax=Mycotypha africana TaxID=64632 RepID=UPI0023017D4A|nr:uncharacterized protein BDF20DRAFT_913285 [Mycotypha africana]KAI8979775.1 hypothetical protein BDF20DRAFT_913285 [Mycotypha africana]